MMETKDKQQKRVPVDCFSRVVGYYSAIRLWNKGKISEFNERKTFNVGKAISRAGKVETDPQL